MLIGGKIMGFDAVDLEHDFTIRKADHLPF